MSLLRDPVGWDRGYSVACMADGGAQVEGIGGVSLSQSGFLEHVLVREWRRLDFFEVRLGPGKGGHCSGGKNRGMPCDDPSTSVRPKYLGVFHCAGCFYPASGVLWIDGLMPCFYQEREWHGDFWRRYILGWTR